MALDLRPKIPEVSLPCERFAEFYFSHRHFSKLVCLQSTIPAARPKSQLAHFHESWAHHDHAEAKSKYLLYAASESTNLCQGATVVVQDAARHPLRGGVRVGAADQKDVVLACTSLRQQRVASPNRPGNHFCTCVGERSGYFREKACACVHGRTMGNITNEHK